MDFNVKAAIIGETNAEDGPAETAAAPSVEHFATERDEYDDGWLFYRV